MNSLLISRKLWHKRDVCFLASLSSVPPGNLPLTWRLIWANLFTLECSKSCSRNLLIALVIARNLFNAFIKKSKCISSQKIKIQVIWNRPLNLIIHHLLIRKKCKRCLQCKFLHVRKYSMWARWSAGTWGSACSSSWMRCGTRGSCGNDAKWLASRMTGVV